VKFQFEVFALLLGYYAVVTRPSGRAKLRTHEFGNLMRFFILYQPIDLSVAVRNLAASD
jgi:hypothetical protein